MKTILALAAAISIASPLVAPASAATYYYHGRHYHYRYHGHYYNYRTCHWNGHVKVCRYR